MKDRTERPCFFLLLFVMFFVFSFWSKHSYLYSAEIPYKVLQFSVDFLYIFGRAPPPGLLFEVKSRRWAPTVAQRRLFDSF